MASQMRDGQIDLHDYRRRLERPIRFLNGHQKVSGNNKRKILQFLERVKAECLSLARQTGYVQRLTTIAVMLDRDFDKAAKQGIERLMAGRHGIRLGFRTRESSSIRGPATF